MYIRRSGADNSGTKVWCQQKTLLSLRSFATSLKKSLWSLILYNFFHDFIYVCSSGAGAENPLGKNFLCQQELLVTSVICCKLKKNLFEVGFYTHFLVILSVYIAPRQGQTAPTGQNSDVNRKAFIHPFVASFKEISLKSDCIHFFPWFSIHVYSSGAGGIQAPGAKFLCQQKLIVTSVICC